MPRPCRLRVTVRTPATTTFDAEVDSLRVPTYSGQVGLRPRVEATVLAVEPGLILARMEHDYRFVGTAGGLLRCDGNSVTLLTPLAVVSESLEDVSDQLERALAVPSEEREVRQTLGRLERWIVQQLRDEDSLGETPRRRT